MDSGAQLTETELPPVRWGPYVSGWDCDICAGIFTPPCPFHTVEGIVQDLLSSWWRWQRHLAGLAKG